MKQNSDYRKIGRDIVSKYTGSMIGIFLIGTIILSIFSSITKTQVFTINGQTFTYRQSVCSWISIFFTGAIEIGYAFVVKKAYYGTEPKIEDLFFGFKDYSKNFVLGLLIDLYTFLWLLLLIVPGIIAAIKYSMAYFIKLDKGNLSPSECINESKKIMEGHKAKYFVFVLSWIGWFFLGILTFGILLLWVIPWFYEAKYAFYLDLTKKEMTSDNYYYY